ncbi:glycosyltransferase [Phenylobacterium immobile]|uniref:glycosyltransferase n=1 Tax=Phenylobacterium immobile TaxID=21 RepID=UPI000B0C8E80|nr:glycosyltransferase [Phenylobacterium immobile]
MADKETHLSQAGKSELRPIADSNASPEVSGWVDTLEWTKGDLRVSGWALDDLSEICEVDLYLSGKKFASTLANIQRKVRSEIRTAGYAFTVSGASSDISVEDIEVRQSRTGLPLQKARRLAIVYRDTVEQAASDAKPPKGAQADRPPRSRVGKTVLGVLETATPQRITGWARHDGVSSPPVVELFVDGVLHSRISASQTRPDISRSGHRGFGFITSIPFSMSAEATSAVLEARTIDGSLGKLPLTGLLAHNPAPKAALSAKLQRFAPRDVTIIIPVFNAPDELRACLQSIVEHTTYAGASVIIIDDASTDLGVEAVLSDYTARPGFSAYQNPQNIGFSGTINRGISLASSGDVILLNSDTAVTPRWVENLRLAAYSDVKVSSATAMSDNAGVFSLPVAEQPHGLSQPELARLVTQSSAHQHFASPTAHGFCVYVRRDALETVGLFDEDAFPVGYGEENDWSMRASYLGWRQVVDDRTIVFHRRGASFGDRKPALLAQGRRVIETRYPEYQRLVAPLASSVPFLTAKARVRSAIATAMSRAAKPAPRIMFVISSPIGGTPQTNLDLMSALQGDCDPFLLTCTDGDMVLSRLQDGVLIPVAKHALSAPVAVTTHRSSEYDDVIAEWLSIYAIELVHIRHIAWHSLGLIDISKNLDIPVVTSLHDYYLVCPTVKLLDNNGIYCGGVCTSGEGYCLPSLWDLATVPNLKHQWVHNWRRIVATSLSKVDAFVTTLADVYPVFDLAYPSLLDVPRYVIQHGRDFPEMRPAVRPEGEIEGPIRVAVPGNINDAKGGKLIAAVKALDVDNLIEFHIIGKPGKSLSDAAVIKHGVYLREDLPDILTNIQPHVGGIFSIWPETYCHTLTELWASGLPVVGYDIGAVGGRISESGAGWLFNNPTAEALYKLLLDLRASSSQRLEKSLAVERWQQTTGTTYGTREMADRYLDVYSEVLDRRRTFRTKAGANFGRSFFKVHP